MPGLDDLGLLWGKARGTPGSYHPLLCHMIDVALVAEAMWEQVLSPWARRRLAAALGIDEANAGRWVAFLAGLHDAGKAAPCFQAQSETDWHRLQAGWGLPGATPTARVPHGVITAGRLPDLLTAAPFNLTRQVAQRLATVVGGHHGQLPRTAEITALAGKGSAIGGPRWERACERLVVQLARVIGLRTEAVPSGLDSATALFLAGLVSVADWIGSNVEFFRYAADNREAPDPTAYVIQVAPQALVALERLGWTGWQPRPGALSFGELFPHLKDGGPNGLQRDVLALAERLHEPGLVIVEAPMGQGKTEAAMVLAERWTAALGQRGYYFALPTQATSNQMFSRVREFLQARYPEDVVNLQLLHGHAALSGEFGALRLAGDRLFEPAGLYDESDRTGGPAEVVAAEWFTHRKRGLLAPFGVGTIDQALLAVLQTKHVFVRLFGLAHKTVIIDEVHAYDTYMSTLLERLLEWLAALDASVVLLSATLPDSRRRRLAQAYASGLNGVGAVPPPIEDAAYPRLTWVTPSDSGAASLSETVAVPQVINGEWLDGRLPSYAGGPFPLGDRLARALAQGGCAAVICNTVGRAQGVFSALQQTFATLPADQRPELGLLHARFLFEGREAREQAALVRFGKPGGSAHPGAGPPVPVQRPRRAVLVATQIIEQSLDLDFDLMVTDLAPVDLVLQRLGRLHRHRRERPPGLTAPTLWIIRPTVEASGAPRFDPGSVRVYDEHVLLRSWLALQARTISDRCAILVPDDLEALVEAVYQERPCPADLPPAVQERWQRTQEHLQEAEAQERQEAKDRYLGRPSFSGQLWRLTADPRAEDAPDFHQAHQALTRLAEPAVSVVCLYGSGGWPTFDLAGQEPATTSSAPAIPEARRLLRRSVGLADRRVVHSLLGQEPPAGWRRSALLRQHRLLLLNSAGVGRVGKYSIRLDVELGVVIAEE